ncbi:MAG: hypothetical protein ACE15B_22535 [Bryobacteraceae bacterium]
MNPYLHALAATLLAAAPGPDTPPAPLQDAVAWPEPTAATPLRVNPPTFRWPGGGARKFEVEMSRSPDFRGAAAVARPGADWPRVERAGTGVRAGQYTVSVEGGRPRIRK